MLMMSCYRGRCSGGVGRASQDYSAALSPGDVESSFSFLSWHDGGWRCVSTDWGASGNWLESPCPLGRTEIEGFRSWDVDTALVGSPALFLFVYADYECAIYGG